MLMGNPANIILELTNSLMTDYGTLRNEAWGIGPKLTDLLYNAFGAKLGIITSLLYHFHKSTSSSFPQHYENIQL